MRCMFMHGCSQLDEPGPLQDEERLNKLQTSVTNARNETQMLRGLLASAC